MPGGVFTRWLPVKVQEIDRSSASGTTLRGSGERAGGDLASALTIVASVETEDRAGDLIQASGWDLAAYERNPVVLWAHQYLAPPIGRSLRTWVEGKSLMATIEFAPTPFAQEVRRLYAGGFLRGVSVGFRAIETEQRKSEAGRRGILFKRQELLEISAAPVPLHPDTLVSGDPWRLPESGRAAADAMSSIRRLWEEIGALTLRCPDEIGRGGPGLPGPGEKVEEAAAR
jgi:HK97 family phage prohead protease